jgi:hypothetical protein
LIGTPTEILANAWTRSLFDLARVVQATYYYDIDTTNGGLPK